MSIADLPEKWDSSGTAIVQGEHEESDEGAALTYHACAFDLRKELDELRADVENLPHLSFTIYDSAAFVKAVFIGDVLRLLDAKESK